MTDQNPDAGGTHRWRFFRFGGFDQVAIETDEDLRHLAELDPKLWTALSCLATGLEYDNRTLALFDADGDGQIRVPEILAAVRWACRMVKDPQLLFEDDELQFEAIDDSHAEGATLKAAAAKVAAFLDKPDASGLAVGDFADMTRLLRAGRKRARLAAAGGRVGGTHSAAGRSDRGRCRNLRVRAGESG